MHLFATTNKRSQGWSLLNPIIYLLLLITPVCLLLFDKKTFLFVFISAMALYPLFHMMTNYLFLNASFSKKIVHLIPFVATIFLFFNLVCSLYLLLGYTLGNLNPALRVFSSYIAYLTPCFIAATILLACQSLDTTLTSRQVINFALLVITLLVVTILALYYFGFIFQPPYEVIHAVYHIEIGIVIIFYLKFLYLLQKKQNFDNRSFYVHVHMLFSLIGIKELLSVLFRYYNFPTSYIVLFIFMAYILFTIQSQRYLIKTGSLSPVKQHLYSQHLDLMNRFLTFKNIEVKNLQTELSIKDQMYKHLFNFAPDAFLISTNGTISYCNEALVKLLNAEDSIELVDKKIWNFIHPNSIANARAGYNDLLSGAKDVHVAELQILSLNNEIKYTRVSSSITFFENTYYMFCCFHDLSADYEQERIQLELEKDIAHEKFKVEFFANISHDLKTPINVIHSAAQLQDMYTLSNEYDKVLVYNNIIKQNCLRLQKLLNDLLDITKIDANHFKPQLQLCNIISNIEYITQSIISYIEHKNISVIFDTNVEDKLTMTDPNFVERIILNLMSNAIKYGKQDGHIWVTLHDEGEHLIISVKDDGVGIPKKHISKIFKRFHKAEHHIRSAISGNGIGLSLVKSMVKALDGTIFCMSEEGVGSEFVAIFPMASHNSDGDIYCEYTAALDLGDKLNIELSDI